ncbi:hypothetical protein [Corynebacterium kalidii]
MSLAVPLTRVTTFARTTGNHLQKWLLRPIATPNKNLELSGTATDTTIVEYPNRRLVGIVAEAVGYGVLLLILGSGLPDALMQLADPYLQASSLSAELKQLSIGLVGLVGFLLVIYLFARLFAGLISRVLRPVTRQVYCPEALHNDLRRTVHNVHPLRSYPESVELAQRLQFIVDELGRVRLCEQEDQMLESSRQRLRDIDRECRALTTTPNTLLAGTPSH